MNTRNLQQSFVGGEIGPDMFSRAEDGKLRFGAARLRNWIVRPTGTIATRPGFKFVAEVKDSTKATRLIPFRTGPSSTVHVEVGEGYFRFHQEGAPVVLDTTPAAYVANQTFVEAAVNVGSNEITLGVAHGVTTGEPIVFTSDLGGTLPAGLSAGVTVYAIAVSSTVLKAASTLALAQAGTAIDITSTGNTTAGSKPHRFQRAYEAMDLVRFSGTNYYCIQDPTSNGNPQFVPGSAPTYWHALTGDIYEIRNEYLAGDLFTITHDQSNDVLTLANRYYPVGELRRYGPTEWQFVEPAFSGSVEPPTGVSVAATPGFNLTVTGVAGSTWTTNADHGLTAGDTFYASGFANTVTGIYLPDGFYCVGSYVTATSFVAVDIDGATGIATSGTYSANSGRVAPVGASTENENFYVVTAVAADGRESIASAPDSVVNNLFARGASNTITWVASTTSGVQRYHVYKRQNGLYGYIGQVQASEALSFVDGSNGIDFAPDLSKAPPLDDDSLDTDYPGAVGHFEQRRLLASTVADPQQTWGTRSGTESDLTYRIPTTDDDRLSFAVASREPATIRHIVPLAQLLLLTDSGEYRVTPVNSDALTPTSVAVRAQSYVGSSHVAPLIVNGTVLFVAARGGHIRELGFDATRDGYGGGDLSIRASHLFDGQEPVDSALTKAPYQIGWWVNDAGLLLGHTYIPEEGVGAWHWHDTDGAFESISAGPEGSEDRLYAITRRTIDGATVRMVEQMGSQAAASIEDSFQVDCGLSYDGAPATAISGLGHLEGEAVSVLADGVVVTGRRVASGALSAALATAASKVHVGLPFTADLQTLPMALQVEAYSHGRTKNVNRAWLRVVDAGQFQVGPSVDRLRSSDPRAQFVGELRDGQVPVQIDGAWTDDGQVWVRQSQPLPVTIVGLVLEVSIGG